MSGWKKLWSMLPALAGFGAFFQQTVSNEVAYQNRTGLWNNFSPTTKAQTVVNFFVKRITLGAVPYVFAQNGGAGPFTGATPNFKNPNIFNGWTIAGIGALIAKHIPIVPYRSKIGRFGVPLLIGGVAGSFFGDYNKPNLSGQVISRSPAYATAQQTTGVNAH